MWRKEKDYLRGSIVSLTKPIILVALTLVLQSRAVDSSLLTMLFVGMSAKLISQAGELVALCAKASRKKNKFLFYIGIMMSAMIAGTYSFVNLYIGLYDVVLESVFIYAASIFFIVLLTLLKMYITKMDESKDVALAA